MYLGRLDRAFGGPFLDPLRRWSNRSPFCTKAKKAARPLAEEEMCSEPANERVEGDEQSEAPDHQEEGTRGTPSDAEGPEQGALDGRWGQFE